MKTSCAVYIAYTEKIHKAFWHQFWNELWAQIQHCSECSLSYRTFHCQSATHHVPVFHLRFLIWVTGSIHSLNCIFNRIYLLLLLGIFSSLLKLMQLYLLWCSLICINLKSILSCISMSYIMFLKLVIDMEIKVLTKSEDLQFCEEMLGEKTSILIGFIHM